MSKNVNCTGGVVEKQLYTTFIKKLFLVKTFYHTNQKIVNFKISIVYTLQIGIRYNANKAKRF